MERQLAHALVLISWLDYAHPFLSMNTILRHDRSKGMLCQGRGSAANPAICCALDVTAFSPIRSGLLFERFISLGLREPPDIT